MTHVSFAAVYGWELRHTCRSPLLWAIVAVLLLSFAWGAHNAAHLHRLQNEAQANARRLEQEWDAGVRAKAEEYRVSASQPLPYWQDPTDIAGFSQYFLFKHSVKPHLPASPLAAGVSDLLPSRLRVKLPTPFALDSSYDFHNPRALALGPFDLAFAIVYLLPVALILAFGLLGTFERDRGVLRLIAAQSVAPATWMGARVGAVATVMLPAIWISLLIALAAAGVPLLAAAPEMIAALLLVGAYALFWMALNYWVLSRWPRAPEAVGALVVVWAMLVIGVPLIANSALSLLAPGTSAAEYVDAKRRIDDQVQADGDDIVAAAFKATPALANLVDRMSSIDYATRLTFIAPENERRLAALKARSDAARWVQDRAATWISLVTPPMGVETALMRLAGTDLQRHRDFEQQTREYQLQLRSYLYPLIHAQIVTPTPRPAPQSYGRFSFTDYESVPSFQMRAESSAARVASAVPITVWLCVLAVLMAVAAVRRSRRWPKDL